jgi:hypothetical protein
MLIMISKTIQAYLTVANNYIDLYDSGKRVTKDNVQLKERKAIVHLSAAAVNNVYGEYLALYHPEHAKKLTVLEQKKPMGVLNIIVWIIVATVLTWLVTFGFDPMTVTGGIMIATIAAVFQAIQEANTKKNVQKENRLQDFNVEPYMEDLQIQILNTVLDQEYSYKRKIARLKLLGINYTDTKNRPERR